MPLDQVENFVEVNVAGNHSSTENTISLQSGEASNLPDPSGGEFNLVWFDSTNFSRPSEDSEVEIVRVTGRDTTNDTITVLRGQENTTAVSHDTTNSDYVLILAQTAKMIKDVDAADFSTNSLTVAGNSVSLGSSTAVDYIDLNDTGSSFPIPNTDLSNSSVSIAGNSVALGGSTVVNHSDLSNIGTGDHHTRYSDEEAQDAVGGILNADFNYDDAGNSIALASNSLTVAGNTAALGGSTAVQYIDLNDTGSSFPIPNNDLSNSSLTVANTSIGLGGSGTPEVDNFNGNNGTAGQFLQTDGTNLIFTDLTVREIQQLINNQAVIRDNLARNNFEDNLDELAYQGGFYDIFRDESKIESKSNVTISTLSSGDSDGKVQLAAVGLIDDFEDGDVAEWNKNGEDFTASSSTVISGSFSGRLAMSGGGNAVVSPSLSSEAQKDAKFKYRIEADNADNDNYNINIYDSSGNRLGLVQFETNSNDVNWFDGSTITTVVSNFWSTNTNYDVRVIVDYANETVDIEIDGTVQASGLAWDDASFSGISYFEFNNFEADGSDTLISYFDDIRAGTTPFKTSGYIIEREDLSSGDDNFSNPPVSLTVNQDADIPADEDIQYIVKDVNGSGDEETITQSEVGTSVDISDFTGFLVEVKTEYSTSDGNDSPTHRSQDFYFEEG